MMNCRDILQSLTVVAVVGGRMFIWLYAAFLSTQNYQYHILPLQNMQYSANCKGSVVLNEKYEL
jgi:hypothetical protein